MVPGTGDVSNGMAVVARLLAEEQGDAEVVDLNIGMRRIGGSDVEEVWVHGMWLPKEWLACLKAIRCGRRLIRMTHGSLSPVYLKHQSPFKKWLVGPIERFCLRRAKALVATCSAEADWIRSYLGHSCPPIIITDIKRFFSLANTAGKTGQTRFPSTRPLHLLYLGRRHPLKGIEYLEAAGRQIQNTSALSASRHLCVRFVSNISGEELEKVWDWCDVLVLPTLSDNFGLVVAEALERGKSVITTDGAPAWGPEECGNMEMLQISNSNTQSGSGIWEGYGGRLVYLKGYRDGTPEERIQLLISAIEGLVVSASNGRNCKIVIDKYA